MENKMKQIRSEKGMTQRQLSDATGISERQICVIENGAATPGLDSANAIAKALGVQIEDIWQLEVSR